VLALVRELALAGVGAGDSAELAGALLLGICFRAMNRHALAAALSLITLPLAAQTPAAAPAPVAATRTAPPAGFKDTIVLWPDGAPLAQGKTEGDIPKLFTYPTAVAGTHAAVIVMPGGGYTHLVMEQEGAYEARWLAAHGVTAFVLEYRLAPLYKYPAAMLDGARAIRYVRSHAAELGVDPGKIGIWGFSAGGHLVSYLETVHDTGNAAATDPVDQVSDRPDFGIISYGRMDMNVPVATGEKPMEQILPEKTQAAVDAIDTVKHVTADTSPTFIYSTTADQTVDSRNASDFYNALKAAGVKAELHIFELGAHGTHMGEALPVAQKELTMTPILIANWMQQHGWMPPQVVEAETSKQ
jgi:acetyl esterase/lipase